MNDTVKRLRNKEKAPMSAIVGHMMSFSKVTIFWLLLPSCLFCAAAPFDFNALAHEEGDPDTYTLVCLDTALIPESAQVRALKAERAALSDVKNWLNRKLLRKLNYIEVEDEASDEESDTHDVSVMGRIESIRKQDCKGRAYYVVRLFTTKGPSSAECLVSRLYGDAPKIETEEFSSAMIIIPPTRGSSDTRVLAYLLGSNWNQLCNPHAIVYDWGLRIAVSEEICREEKIKRILGKNNFDANPRTLHERKQFLAPIEAFTLEVGTEGLQSLTVLPLYETVKGSRCQRLMSGRDTLKFSLPQQVSGGSESTVAALFAMADYMHHVFQLGKTHPKFRLFIDSEVTESEVVERLDGIINDLLHDPAARDKIFQADTIWKLYGTSPFFPTSGDPENKDFFTVMQEVVSIHSEIGIRSHRAKIIHKEHLGRLICTLPLEDPTTNAFYRFDRGRWFKVDSSRFDKIIEVLRKHEVPLSLPALSAYTIDDAREGSQKRLGQGVNYKEAIYNRRIVQALDPRKGVLLDRINVSLGGVGNQFEFGDVLLRGDNGEYYIIHVKRKGAGDFSHHRTQVERCADYLGTELAKESAKDLLLKGCIDGMYTKFGIPTNKAKGQKDRLTHGDYFKKLIRRGTREAFDRYLQRILDPKFSKNSSQKSLKDNLQKFQSIELAFFEQYPDELIIVLDALYDCAEKRPISEEEISGFIGAVKQSIEARNVLFPSGPLKRDIKKKVHIVMAIIDDRKIDKILEAEQDVQKAQESASQTVKQKSGRTIALGEAKEILKAAKDDSRENETPLFHKQDLWGLDHTRKIVQKQGFHFNLVVINEAFREGWDVFGEIKGDLSDSVDDAQESSSSKDGDDEPEMERRDPASFVFGRRPVIEDDDNVSAAIPDSVKQESIKLAASQGIIGPRRIPGWELHDVRDVGNCFYEAVAHQMELLHYLFPVPAGTEVHDSLRARVQGEYFQDREWTDDLQIDAFVKKFPDVMLAIVDTRTPGNGFVHYYTGEDGDVVTHVPDDGKSLLPRPVLHLAFTGNHFLSVKRYPTLSSRSVLDVVDVDAGFSGDAAAGPSILPPHTAQENHSSLRKEKKQMTLDEYMKRKRHRSE